jgi:hypothetical protein
MQTAAAADGAAGVDADGAEEADVLNYQELRELAAEHIRQHKCVVLLMAEFEVLMTNALWQHLPRGVCVCVCVDMSSKRVYDNV